eukprot:m.171478 g.171478  ORF g.171478 m.171478 type:complete len:543 (-) comp14813_c0_seq1:2075-3703(-)
MGIEIEVHGAAAAEGGRLQPDLTRPDSLVIVDAGQSVGGAETELILDFMGVGSKSPGSDGARAMLSRLEKATSVSSFGGGSSTGLVDVGGHVQNVTVCITPRVASRHNCLTRPDVVTKLVKSAISKVTPATAPDSTDAGREAKRVRLVPRAVVMVLLPNTPEHDPISQCVSVAAAIARAAPVYSRKSASGRSAAVSVCFGIDGKLICTAEQVARIQAIVDAVRAAGALVDTPCNELTTTEFAKRAETLAASVPGVTFEMLTGDQLKDEGLGGLYGVGQAAVEPPRLVMLHYVGPNPGPESICWVGKGIVYDTGGLSIKSKTGMPGMKRDMGGAAAVMEAFFAAAKTGASVTLTAVLCLAENAVGPDATRPDDIHTFFSGKTVEINNTDAEGRLVLADGVAYAIKRFEPSVIVDICTLTGAQGVATGKHFGAVMASSEGLERRAVLAGRACGDMCHPVPYAPELFSNEFRSEVADMKNSVANRSNAQVSCAGQFIGNHIDWDTFKGEWLHIDMASPAHFNERGTGYGVALLLQTFVYPTHSKM